MDNIILEVKNRLIFLVRKSLIKILIHTVIMIVLCMTSVVFFVMFTFVRLKIYMIISIAFSLALLVILILWISEIHSFTAFSRILIQLINREYE